MKDTVVATSPCRLAGIRRLLRLHPAGAVGAAILAIVIVAAFAVPFLGLADPAEIDPTARLRGPSAEHRLGTDALGRDVASRVIWGAQTSLLIGLAVAAFASVLGVAIGIVAGFYRLADAILMRVMDGLMAIPGILLAMAMMALFKANFATVIVAITVPEIPRIVRLVRSIVLAVRNRVYVDAARALGTRDASIMWVHILPSIVAPVIVQATFVCSSAILIEAYLSFLGVGTPTEIPSWGNIMAEGRLVIELAWWTSLFPALLLGATVLAINLFGDALRDALDPAARRQI